MTGSFFRYRKRFQGLVFRGLSLSLLLNTACQQDLPEEGLIIAPRVLSISTEVTSSLLPPDPDLPPDLPPKVQALPFDTVTISPMIVSPEGYSSAADLQSTYDPLWIACELAPGSALSRCLRNASPITLAQIPQCEKTTPQDLAQGEIPAPLSPCLIAREGAPDYQVPFSANMLLGGSIELTMIASSPGGSSTEQCAQTFLNGDYQLPDDCLFAVQRLRLGPLEQLAELAAQLGLSFEGLEAPDTDTKPIQDPDRAIRITEFSVTRFDADGVQLQDPQPIQPGDTISASLGEVLRMDVFSPEEDLQYYSIAVNNGESYETKQEAYQAYWYRSFGTLLSFTSNDPKSYNEWRLLPGEQDRQEHPEDPIFLYYVVRDGRQGVHNFWFAVNLQDD